jgi:hypothetical protein
MDREQLLKLAETAEERTAGFIRALRRDPEVKAALRRDVQKEKAALAQAAKKIA